MGYNLYISFAKINTHSTEWFMATLLLGLILVAFAITKLVIYIKNEKLEKQYRELEIEVFRELGINTWNLIPNVDRIVYVKSHQTL